MFENLFKWFKNLFSGTVETGEAAVQGIEQNLPFLPHANQSSQAPATRQPNAAPDGITVDQQTVTQADLNKEQFNQPIDDDTRLEVRAVVGANSDFTNTNPYYGKINKVSWDRAIDPMQGPPNYKSLEETQPGKKYATLHDEYEARVANIEAQRMQALANSRDEAVGGLAGMTAQAPLDPNRIFTQNAQSGKFVINFPKDAHVIVENADAPDSMTGKVTAYKITIQPDQMPSLAEPADGQKTPYGRITKIVPADLFDKQAVEFDVSHGKNNRLDWRAETPDQAIVFNRKNNAAVSVNASDVFIDGAYYQQIVIPSKDSHHQDWKTSIEVGTNSPMDVTHINATLQAATAHGAAEKARKAAQDAMLSRDRDLAEGAAREARIANQRNHPAHGSRSSYNEGPRGVIQTYPNNTPNQPYNNGYEVHTGDVFIQQQALRNQQRSQPVHRGGHTGGGKPHGKGHSDAGESPDLKSLADEHNAQHGKPDVSGGDHHPDHATGTLAPDAGSAVADKGKGATPAG